MLDIAAPLLDIVHIDQVREAPQVARLQQHQGRRLGLGGTVEAGHPHALGPGVEFSRNFRHPACLLGFLSPPGGHVPCLQSALGAPHCLGLAARSPSLSLSVSQKVVFTSECL